MIDSKSLERIRDALAVSGKRAALADEIGVSEGQLSKMLSGELAKFCHLLDLLGLETQKKDYVRALETVLKERL